MISSNPKLVLEPCLPTDIDQMVAIYFAAFDENYLSKFSIPSTVDHAVKTEWATKRFLGMFDKPQIKMFKVTDLTTQKLVAWVRWSYPIPSVPADKQPPPPMVWPEGSNLEVIGLKFGPLVAIRKREVDPENDYVCELLQTDPAYQGKGAGGMLLKHGLAIADAEGRRCYIEATPEGYPVYQRYGFRDLESVIVDLSKWGGKEPGVNCVMIRDAKSAV